MSAPDPSEQPTLDGLPVPRPASLPSRYEVLGEVGAGGMGIVYKARDRETGELVALKTLRPEIAADAAALERFKNELRLARKITHKNVCRIHEFHSTESGACISMEFVEGQSLRALLGRVGGISIRYALQVLGQILAGVAEAHAQGVVHRDLKPENILIAADGTVKVMDFGLARAGESQLSIAGSISGTPAYMSPEQAEGKPADARSDIYALGLVIYEMFTGRMAFQAETPIAMVAKQVHEAPPPPRQFEPDLPERIARAIERCLEKAPKKRFQSVSELETALKEKAAPEVLGEEEPAVPPHLLRWARLDWVLLAAGVLGFFYFLNVRDQVFPASKLLLEVDVLGARRAVEDMAGRLGMGMRFPATSRGQAVLDFRGALRHGGWPVGWDGEPLVWRVREWRGPFTNSATVDRKGKVERLQMPAWNVGNYRPPPAEERRALAIKAAETVCGSTPRGKITESSGGELDTQYTVEWSARTATMPLQPIVKVSLLADRVTEVNCNVPAERTEEISIGIFRWAGGTLATGLVLLVFLLGRSYRLPASWKRVSLAAVLGATAGWMFYPGVEWQSSPEEWVLTGKPPTQALFLLSSLAFTALFWMGLVTAEHSLRRRAPQWAASYLLAWRLRLTEPAVVMAVVRGALAGLALVAFETLVAHLTVLGGLGRLLRLYVDHEPVEQAIRSSFPALFSVATALLDAVLIGLVFLGLSAALKARTLFGPSRWRRVEDFMGMAAAWWLTGLHLHLANFLFPSLGGLFVFFLEGVFLAWLLYRYDVLTVVAAVFTAVLWIINFPLLEIFRQTGNGAHWAVLGGWAAVIALAARIAFRPVWEEARRQMMARFD